jgi:hypothetical protein
MKTKRCSICGKGFSCDCEYKAKRDGSDIEKLREKARKGEKRHRGYPFDAYDNVHDHPRGW